MAPKSGFFAVCAAAAITFILGAALMGCGSNNNEGEAMDSGAGTGGYYYYTGGSGGVGGTTGGTGGATGGTGGATGGTGGSAGIDGGNPNACDTTVTSATTCGTETCPAVSTWMAQYFCQVNCCVNDQCGTRYAYADQTRSTDCTVAVQADPRCEDITVSGGMMGQRTFDGCCTADNQCGGINTRQNTCVSRADLAAQYSGVPAPRACDEPAPDSGA